jgi:hypothetical protein
VQVLVSDLHGTPVEGAAVRTGSDSGSRTDASGSALVRFVPGDSLAVMAAGFAPGSATLPLDPNPAGPVEVRLEAAVTLVLVAERLPRGASSPMRLVWERAPFLEYEGPQQVPRMRYLFYGVTGPTQWSEPGSMSFSCWDRLGQINRRVFVPALAAGREVTAELLDCLGQPLVQRVVKLPDEPVTFEVLLDPADGQVAHIELELEGTAGGRHGGQAWVTNGDRSASFDLHDGRGRSGDLVPGRYDLTIEPEGCLPVELADVLVEAGSGPLLVPVTPSGAMTVEARDANGRLLSGDASLMTSGGGRIEPAATSTGPWTFEHLPLEALELHVDVGGRTWTRSLAVGERGAVLDLPAHGELQATWSTPRASGSHASFAIEAASVEAPGVGQAATRFSPDVVDRVETRLDLLPGDYDLTFVLLEDTQAGEAREVLGRRRVTVAAEGLTRVSLD